MTAAAAAGLASITAISSGWRVRFVLADDPAFGPHISSRILETTGNDGGWVTVYGLAAASPVTPAVFAEAASSPAAAFLLLRRAAACDGYGLDPDEPVGLEEIAARMNAPRVTVDKWRQRRLLPPPTWPRVGGRPAWRWAVIEQWARETGRRTV